MSRVERYGSKRKKWKRILAAAGLVTVVYIGGMAFFHTHYYPKTKVGNIDLGFKSRQGAREYVKDELEKYSIIIREKDGEESISAADAGLSFSDIDKIDKILKEQSYGPWPVNLTKHFDFGELNIQVDEGKLSSYVDTLKCMNPETPEESVSASISYDKENKQFQINPETIGNIVDKEHFLNGLTEAMTHHDKEISLVEDTYYVQPKYYASSEPVIDANEKLNKYLQGIVTYKDGDLKTKTYKKDIAEMLTWSDDFEVKFDKKKVKSFVKNNVSKTFNSLEGDIPSGITAWKVGVDKESTQLIKNIKSGKRTSRKPVYIKEGLNRDEYNIGKTFIDVNISDQRMWYVEDGKIQLSSDVVTGNLSTGHGTSTGFYRIAYKQRDHLMVKYNSFVHYWMPYNTAIGVGFHDASWRGSFGGQIYRTNGSHGCINMPPAKAASLFNMISSGTAVYIHW
ncbi:MAG: L,D-transpeptidase family protein [Eubacterium sp.]|nr:L,D-transpeptidase family protein [Eubacterium sp.]